MSSGPRDPLVEVGDGNRAGSDMRFGGLAHSRIMKESIQVRPEETHPDMSGAEGFEEFFRHESDRLFRALLVVCRNAPDAEDTLQEAFAKIWERWGRVSSLEDPTGYLFRTALNLHFQTHRRAMRAARRFVGPNPHGDLLDQVDAKDAIARALLTLPQRQRAAIVVTELLGYSSVEAAKILGVRAGTVRRLASQARGRMRILTKEGNNE